MCRRIQTETIVVLVVACLSGTGCDDSEVGQWNFRGGEVAEDGTNDVEVRDATAGDGGGELDGTTETDADVEPPDTAGESGPDTTADIEWTKLFDADGVDEVDDVFYHDKNKTIYVAGSISGSVEGKEFNGGESDAFVAKFFDGGALAWIRLVGANRGSGNAVAVDKSPFGPVHVAWNVETDVETRGMVTTIGGRGEVKSTYRVGEGNPDIRARDLESVSPRRVLVTGTVGSSDSGWRTEGQHDAFVVSLEGSAPDGSLERDFLRVGGTEGDDGGLAFASRRLESRTRTFVLEYRGVTGGSSDDALVVVELEGKLETRDVASIGVGDVVRGHDWAYSLTAGRNQLLVTGGLTRPAGTHADALVASYNFEGDEIYSRRSGSAMNAFVVGVDDLSSGELWGAGLLDHEYPEGRAYVARFATEGRRNSTQIFGGATVVPKAVATSATGGLFVVGRTERPLGGGTNTPDGMAGFVAEIDAK